jgi:hypothetical protein
MDSKPASWLACRITAKVKDLFGTKAYACLADAGAFIFIDAIDPVGTLNPRFTSKWGRLRKPGRMKSTWAASRVKR